MKNGSSQGQNLALTVLHAPGSLDSGWQMVCARQLTSGDLPEVNYQILSQETLQNVTRE